MKDGTRQSERFPAALAAGFDVDELRLEDLIAMSAGLGNELNFIDFNNLPDGTWGSLFDADEALILARIMSFDRSVRSARLLEDFDATPAKYLVEEIGSLVRIFDTWLARLEIIDQPAASAVSLFMSDMVKSHLKQELISVWPLFYVLPTTQQATAEVSEIGNISNNTDRATRIEPSQIGFLQPTLTRFPALTTSARERLRGQFASISSAISRVQDFARTQFPLSLQSQAHDPAASMLIAFLQLFQSVQKRFNRFTHRHTDFYYFDCLQAQPRKATPDCAHIVLVRDPTFKQDILIPGGTAFAAGKDESGTEIEFLSDRDLSVNTARVAALCTLRMERDPLISPEHEFRYVTRTIANRLQVVPSVTSGNVPHWLLFGGMDSHGDIRTNEDAQFGLAIASRQLFLKEGKREIRLTLRFDEQMEADASVRALVKGHAKKADVPLIFLADRLRKLANDVVATAAATPESQAGASVVGNVGGKDDGKQGSKQSGKPDKKESQKESVKKDIDDFARRTAVIVIQSLSDRVHLGGLNKLLTMCLSSDFPATADDTNRALLVRQCATELIEQQSRLIEQLKETHAPLIALFMRYFALDPKLHFGFAGDVGLYAADLAITKTTYYAGIAERSAHHYFHQFLAQLVTSATDIDTFFVRLGKLVRCWLLDDQDWLTTDNLDAIRKRFDLLAEGKPNIKRQVAQLDEGDLLSLIYCKEQPDHSVMWLRPDRDLIFDRLIARLFRVSVSVATGWLQVNDAFAIRDITNTANTVARRGATQRGITLVVPLRSRDAAVIGCMENMHGSQWQTKFPLLRLQLSSHARMHGYSLLGSAVLSEVEIAVRVSEARDVLLNNNLGRLDPSKPFNPFGPLPDQASYLVVGSPEIGRKNLTALSINMIWGGLPQDVGGFAAHYRGYDSVLYNQSFAVSTSLLRDGQWKHLGGEGSTRPLFVSEPGNDKVAHYHRIRVDQEGLGGQFRATDEIRLGDIQTYDLNSRNGFFKFQLVKPAGGFGHAEYPTLLSRTISENVRRKYAEPLPNAPYTPLLEGLTLDYEAMSTLRPGRVTGATAGGATSNGQPEKLYHLHPFGIREICPAQTKDIPTVLPLYAHDGNLFVGIEGGEPGNTLSLLFHLRDEEAATYNHGNSPLSWSYLVGNEWRQLVPARILDDTTSGFLTTGIVRINLPDDIDREHSILATGMLWLCVSADRDFECFAGLYSVRAQAVSVTRVIRNPLATGDMQRLPVGTIKAAVATIPGVLAINQIGDSFGMRSAETTPQLYARIGERLRHKNRAATPWDYERLVLEKFPQVFKTKCFANLISPSLEAGLKGASVETAVSPDSIGHVLIVVVPMLTTATQSAHVPVLNAVELKHIREYLQTVSSGCAQIAVRNAAYERIQVKCTVELEPGAQVGLSLQAINRTLEEYLSPWHEGGYEARFNWAIRQEDVDTHIRTLSFIRNVTLLSLLRIAEDDFGEYTIDDTARKVPVPAERVEMRPGWPWSIAVPMGWHLIEIAGQEQGRTRNAKASAPQPTGIGHLRVGGSYIIGGADDQS